MQLNDTENLKLNDRVECTENISRQEFEKKYDEQMKKYPDFDQDADNAYELVTHTKIGKYITMSSSNFMKNIMEFYLSYPINEIETKEFIDDELKNLTAYKYINFKFHINSYNPLYIPENSNYSVTVDKIKTDGFETPNKEFTIRKQYRKYIRSKNTWLGKLYSSFYSFYSYLSSLYYTNLYFDHNSEYSSSYEFNNNELHITLSIPHSNKPHCLTMAASMTNIKVPWYIRNVKINIEYY